MQKTYNNFQGVKLKYSGSALMIFFVKCKTAVQGSAVSLIKYSREKCGTNLTVFPLINALGAYLISKLEGAVLICRPSSLHHIFILLCYANST